jgi:hypothetical protein
MAFKKVETNSDRPSVDARRVQFEKKGDNLEGHLVEKATLNTKDGKPFKKYTFKTKQGIVSTLGSHQLDSGLSQVEVGSLVRVTFQGLKRLNGGKSVKLFDVEVDDDGEMSAEDLIDSARV